MINYLFITILLCEALLAGMLGISLLLPERRIWPPPGKNSWQIYAVWSPIILAFIAVLILGVLDWNSLHTGDWVSYAAGGMFLAGGYAIYFWSRRCLGWKTMMGIKGRFITRGIYGHTRNPMYLADITLCIGFALLCNSGLVYIVTSIGIILFIITPFTEEPWLREQYGTEYDDYMKTVPRFLPGLHHN